MSEVIAYVDGACVPNPGTGAWGLVLMSGDHRKELCGGPYPNVTNNLMELGAVYHAIDEVKPGNDLEIHTDSNLVIGWLSQGWKRKDLGCAHILIDIEVLSEQKNIALSFVKTNDGNQYLQLAHALAHSALEEE